MLRLMRSALLNSGNRMSAVRTALLQENGNDQGAALRPALTRGVVQHRRPPGIRLTIQDYLWDFLSETLRGSCDISHLHIFFCEFLPLCPPTAGRVHKTGVQENFAAPISWGCSRSPGDRRRARRDVRLRASSLRWTPRVRTSSRGIGEGAVCGAQTQSPGRRHYLTYLK